MKIDSPKYFYSSAYAFFEVPFLLIPDIVFK